MVSTPAQNLNDFLKNRPPLVVFLICLVLLAVSTFYFAFEIERDGPTVNSDKEHDWMQMLKHFNKLDICINSSTWTNEINSLENEELIKTEVSVLTKVTIKNANVLKSLSEIDGALSLEDWQSTTCEDLEKQPKNLEIFFDVPPLTNNTSKEPIDVCVSIKGPAEFLPTVKTPMCKLTGKAKNPKPAKGFLSSKLPRIYDPKFCEKGEIAKLLFDLSMPEIENYLSDDVRTQIYIHLMWCSYFLVFVIFGILLFSILRKSHYLEKKEQSARLL